MSLAAKRSILKKSEAQIRENLNNQSTVLEGKFQSKLGKLALVGGGLLAGYALYKLISEPDEEPESSAKKKNRLSDMIYNTLQELMKSAIPFILSRLEGLKESKNDSQATSRK